MTVFESLLNQTFTISRRQRTTDGQGGHTLAYVAIGTALGRLRPAGSIERQLATQEQRRIGHVLYLVHGTDVARGDQVSGDGVTVEVLAVREPSRAGEHLEVDCEEIQQEVAV